MLSITVQQVMDAVEKRLARVSTVKNAEASTNRVAQQPSPSSAQKSGSFIGNVFGKPPGHAR